MISAGAFAVLAAFVAASAPAQSDKAPAFDVVSVKQHVIPFRVYPQAMEPEYRTAPRRPAGVAHKHFLSKSQ